MLKRLANGEWNKPPVLTTARKLIIRELGKTWPSKALGDLAEFCNGTSYDRPQLQETGTPIIRIANITDPTAIFIRTQQQFEGKYRVVKGDLLASWSASFKTIVWPGPDGILNQHIFKVTEKRGCNRGYLRHAIEAIFDDMQRKVVGIGMMHLRRGDFLGYAVPIPDESVQITVAAYLDWIEQGSHSAVDVPLPQL